MRRSGTRITRTRLVFAFFRNLDAEDTGDNVGGTFRVVTGSPSGSRTGWRGGSGEGGGVKTILVASTRQRGIAVKGVTMVERDGEKVQAMISKPGEKPIIGGTLRMQILQAHNAQCTHMIAISVAALSFYYNLVGIMELR